MHADPSKQAWSLAMPGRLAWHAWPDEEYVVLYSSFTGDTHLVFSPVMDLVQLLDTAPCDERTIVSTLSTMHPDESETDIARFVSESLLELQGIGIVACHSI